jgi:hypothetical protein
MNNWSELHIGIVYIAGLLIGLLAGIAIIIWIQPLKVVLTKIAGKFEIIWTRSFKTTLVLAVLLGAMSVSFRDCYGNYAGLLGSGKTTLMKGFEQVSSSLGYLAVILGLWLFIFILLYLARKGNAANHV